MKKLAFTLTLALASFTATAATILLPASSDTYFPHSPTPGQTHGLEPVLLAGRDFTALLNFDTSSIPAGSIIQSVKITLTSYDPLNPAYFIPQNHGLFQTIPWGETDEVLPLSSRWLNTNLTVNFGLGTFNFEGVGLKLAFQKMVNGEYNGGFQYSAWMTSGGYLDQTYYTFWSKQGNVAPFAQVEYTPTPEPTTAAALIGGIGILLGARRRRV